MDHLELAQKLVGAAVRAGAHEAEVYLQMGDEFNVQVRGGEIEILTQASGKGLGLRVFVDKRMAFASTTDFAPAVIADMVKSTVRLAGLAGRDRHNGLPDVVPGPLPHLDLYDPSIPEMPADRKIEMAREAERAALDYDPRVTSTYGAGFSTHSGTRILANSNGILYSNSGTDTGVSCAPIAEQGTERQIGHYWSEKRFLKDLDSPSEVGREAARLAVQKLQARKVETQTVPVIFSWMVGPGLLGAIFRGLDGEAVHKKMSFLRNKLGKRIASCAVTIIDDPLMPGGLGSMPFDGEGVVAGRKVVVDKGILQLYFYDSRTARKYRGQPTGNARRGFSGLPSVSPTNFYLEPTETDPSEIIRGVKNGFYVADTIGHGANVVTGDFSVGAAGVWIRDGEFAFPVQEVTVAGNMLDMLRNIEQVGSDARWISSVVSPTFKIAEMTVGGR
jgi:PmbA protein